MRRGEGEGREGGRRREEGGGERKEEERGRPKKYIIEGMVKRGKMESAQ